MSLVYFEVSTYKVLLKEVIYLDVKGELGKKIRMNREKKRLTREELCEDEVQLTVRQLARIETGQSLPTLPKLTFISQKLAIPLHHLIDDQYIDLPKGYLELKRKIVKFPTYNNPEREQKRDYFFDKVFEEYYDILPEEEQLSIDVLQASYDVHYTENIQFGTGILQEYFYQVQRKIEYSINDLLIINLYFQCAVYNNINMDHFKLLIMNMIEQVDYTDEEKIFYLERTLMTGAGVMVVKNYYTKDLLKVISILQLIIEKGQNFSKKPLLEMFHGKYLLFGEKKINSASKKYENGALIAELLGDLVLSERVKEEWEKDYRYFKLNNLLV